MLPVCEDHLCWPVLILPKSDLLKILIPFFESSWILTDVPRLLKSSVSACQISVYINTMLQRTWYGRFVYKMWHSWFHVAGSLYYHMGIWQFRSLIVRPAPDTTVVAK